MPHSPDQFYPIPSEKKELGWQEFLRFLPAFLRNPRPTSRELPVLHRLATRHAGEQPYPAETNLEAAWHLITDDHPDFQSAEQVGAAARSVRDAYLVNLRRDPSYLAAPHTVHMSRPGEIIAPVKFHVFAPRRGHYRQYGTRQIGNQPPEVINSAHGKSLYTPDADGEMQEDVFIGLTDRLPEVTKQLCDKADQLLTEAETLDEKLAAATFFQLIGVNLVHPFVDGNGRTFGAKLVLDLQRLGMDIRKIPGLPEIADQLGENFMAGIGPIFLSRFMSERGPGMFDGQYAANDMMINPVTRRQYMTHLHDSIATTIDEGVTANTFMSPYIESAVHMLKLCLSRDGFIDRNYYDQNIQEVLDQTAAYRE